MAKNTHAIIYTGAPHGENESGDIVTRHTSAAHAFRALEKRFSGTTGMLNNVVVALDASGGWDRSAALDAGDYGF